MCKRSVQRNFLTHVMSARVSPTIVSMLPSRVSPILHYTIWAPAQRVERGGLPAGRRR